MLTLVIVFEYYKVDLTSLVISYSTCLSIKPFFSGSNSTFTESSSASSENEKHKVFGDFSLLIFILAERRSDKSPKEGVGNSAIQKITNNKKKQER